MGSSTAAKLREYRLRAGLTQEQLAVHAGITAKTVASAERGDGVPHRSTLILVANVLGCKVDDLKDEPEEIAA